VRLDEAAPGTGLGLSIVSELAELHEGHLELGAAPKLGGLRATLKLPLA
ncbi:MAG: ATP-binding protein, partial [Pseudomonadota bacterium]